MKNIAITIGADPKTKVVIIGFSSAVNRIELPPEAALDFARQIMTRVAIASGKAPPSGMNPTPAEPPVLTPVNNEESDGRAQ